MSGASSSIDGADSPASERPLGGLVRHSLIYSAAPIIRQALSIGMTRFYTAWLGTAGAGVKENADLWGIALQQVLGQNVLASMVRFYYDQKDERKRALVVTSCTLLILLAAFAVCALGFLFVPTLTELFLGRGGAVPADELREVCALLLLLVPFQLATVSGNYYLFARKLSGAYTIIQTVKFGFELALNVYLMGVRGLGVSGFLLSMLIGEVLTSVGLGGWMFLRLKPRFDWKVLEPILRYAAPLVPVGLLQLFLHHADKRIVLELLGQEEAGVYGFGYRIAYLVTNLVLGPFVVTWQPWIFGIEDRAERARLVARVSTYAVLAVAVASLGVILLGRQATLLLAGDPGFHAAARLVPFLATSYVFWALYHVAQTPLFLDKRTAPLIWVNLGAVGLNVALNYALIPLWGLLGAGVATLFTFVALAVAGMLAGRHAAGVRFELRRLTTVLLAVVVGGGCALGLDALESDGSLGPWMAPLLKCVAGFLLTFALWSLVLESEERSRFVRWVRGKLPRAFRGAA